MDTIAPAELVAVLGGLFEPRARKAMSAKQTAAVESTLKAIAEKIGTGWRHWGSSHPTTFTIQQPGAGSSIVHFGEDGLIAPGMGRPAGY